MKKIIQVPYINQSERWPTGCESVTATMCLQYWGLPIEVDDFIRDYIEAVPFVWKDGIQYGADPRESFVGSPYDSESYGCYAPVILRAFEKIAEQNKNPDLEFFCLDATGVSMEQLIREYIDKDIPVVFWATIDLKEVIIGPQWKLHGTGEDFIWKSNEHCMLLVGYDETCYYFNDPWENHGCIGYPKELVEKRHKEQYEMAVVLEVQRKV